MKEYWVKFRYRNGHESLVVMPSAMKLCWWLLRYGWRCASITVTTMWDI